MGDPFIFQKIYLLFIVDRPRGCYFTNLQIHVNIFPGFGAIRFAIYPMRVVFILHYFFPDVVGMFVKPLS